MIFVKMEEITFKFWKTMKYEKGMNVKISKKSYEHTLIAF